jgi:hypothetical protein
LGAGCTTSLGSCVLSGSAKYRADAAVTAVPRLWPRSTVREDGWPRSCWMYARREIASVMRPVSVGMRGATLRLERPKPR